MSDLFVPFVSPNSTSTTEEIESFQSVSQMPEPSNSPQLRDSTPQNKQSTDPSTDSEIAASPQVILRRDGDKVTHICVQCSCGKSIEVACEY